MNKNQNEITNENKKSNRQINKKYLLLMFFISFSMFFIFKDSLLFTPISFYVTSVHEVCHAITTILTGGTVMELNLHNSGGFVASSGGIFPLISMSGYIGTAIIGATMLYCSKSETLINIYFTIFSITIILVNIIFINSYFNIWFFSSVFISVLILISVKLHYTRYIGVILSSIFAVDSFQDIRAYLLLKLVGFNGSKTDAEILAEYFHLSWFSFVFALLFSALTIFIYYKMFKIILKSN